MSKTIKSTNPWFASAVAILTVVGFLVAGSYADLSAAVQEKAKQEKKEEAKKESKDEKAASSEESDDDAIDLTGIKCIKNGKAAAKLESVADYRDSKVYFCCDNCSAAFAKNPDKLSTKANHQLVLTGQFVQKACPISGGDVDESITCDVGGVEVAMCCNNCKKKVDSAADLAAKSKLVFADKFFEKGFEKKEAEISLDGVKCFLMPKKDVVKDKSEDYLDGKVFFCCGGCAKKFAKDPSKHTVKANQQLVSTGQYKQTNCPITGKPVVDGKEVTVDGIEVGLCCGGCKKKVEGAADEAAKADLLFAEKAFENGFEKK